MHAFLIRSFLTKKAWNSSLLFHGQKSFTSSNVNWIMKRTSSQYTEQNNKRSKTNNMADNTLKSAPESRHSSPDNIKEVNGDLFTSPKTHSLAHCISADVKMGKGIAVMFKKEFDGVTELLNQGQRPGGLAVLKRGDRFIYYLVTKEKYWEKPTYDTLWSSLKKMRDHNKDNGVTNICMPKIGCGLDRLKWHVVLKMIQDIYSDLDIQITIYHYEDDKKGAGKERAKPRNFGGHEQAGSRGQSSSHRNRPGNGPGSETRHSSAPHGQSFQREGNCRQAGSAKQPLRSEDNREYGPAPPYKAYKGNRRQNFPDFARSQTASCIGKETYQEEFPALNAGKSIPQDEETCRENDEDLARRNLQKQESKHRSKTKDAASSPVKIKRESYQSGRHGHDGYERSEVETRDRRGNDGVRKDKIEGDDDTRKVDGQSKRQEKARDNDQRQKLEGGNQKTSKKGRHDEYGKRKDADEGQKTRDGSKERRKESPDGVRKDKREDDDDARKDDGQSKRQEKGRDNDQRQKLESGNQETSKNGRHDEYRKRKDEEEGQKTRDGSKERRKENHDGVRKDKREDDDDARKVDENQDKHSKSQTYTKKDDLSQDKSETEKEQGKKLNIKEGEYKEDDKTSGTKNQSHSDCKNSDDVSLASANESTVQTLPSHEGDCEDDGEHPSGLPDDAKGSRKKKKKKKKKKKTSSE